jgi:hypothetical protein
MDTFNYFNYFTEIEEHFWRKRGAHLLVSPLDWAIVETWQRAGIPIEAVLRGIDTAFDNYQRSRRAAGRPLKSLAYCVDAVLDAAAELQAAATGAGPRSARPAAANAGEHISREEVRAFFARNAERMDRAAKKLEAKHAELARHVSQMCGKFGEISGVLDSTAPLDLEDVERRLTILEEKLSAILAAQAPEEILLEIRRDLDRQLAPYRRRMTAEQLAQLERQYTQKQLFEKFDLPRLSLFYLT